jgi:hypothetical protein
MIIRSIASVVLLHVLFLLLILPHTRIHALLTKLDALARRNALQPHHQQDEWTTEPFEKFASDDESNNEMVESSFLELPIHLMKGKPTAAQRQVERANGEQSKRKCNLHGEDATGGEFCILLTDAFVPFLSFSSLSSSLRVRYDRRSLQVSNRYIWYGSCQSFRCDTT